MAKKRSSGSVPSRGQNITNNSRSESLPDPLESWEDFLLALDQPVSAEPAAQTDLDLDEFKALYEERGRDAAPIKPDPAPAQRDLPKQTAGSEPAELPKKMPELPVKGPDKKRADKTTQPLDSEKNGKLILPVCAAIAVLVIIIGFLSVYLLKAASDPFGNRIMHNVSVCGIDVGGLTKGEAKKALKEVVGNSYRENDMVVKLPDTDLLFSPKETGVSLDVNAAVKAAYAFGRSGTAEEQIAAYTSADTEVHVIDLIPYLHLNEEFVQNALNDYGKQYTGTYIPSGYTLEGDMPALSEEEFDSSAPCQTIVLQTGTPGFTLDMEAVYQLVLDAYNAHRFQVDVSGMDAMADPEPLDLAAVRDAVVIEPVNSSLDYKTMVITPGSYGYSFDLDAAEKFAATAGYGETLRLSMEYVAPELLGEDAYFQDELGHCETPHGNNENRTDNLRLACSSLNGLIIQPGETISYNEILGERTTENGYKPAPAYSGTRLIDSIGGGICQVSSTLYLSSVFAELEIVDRVNHGYPVNYIPAGLDATVSWGNPDLKIRNNTELPVKILAKEEDGFVKISIMGVETRPYTVKMAFQAGGYYAIAWKCKYDRETGELISKENFSRSGYLNNNLNAIGEIGPYEAYVNGVVVSRDPAVLAAEAAKTAP